MLVLSSACLFVPSKGESAQDPIKNLESTQGLVTTSPVAEPRLLTICLGQEPTSLFLYGDTSAAARNVLSAIYDGPWDVRNYEFAPVILEDKPTQAAGEIVVEPVVVQAGNIIVDNNGNLNSLKEGVAYLPAGCSDPACAQVFSGQEPVQIDQFVVHFKIRSGILWSDGVPLTAADSEFSFNVAKELYPQARAELILRTQSYLALDEHTVEWRGVPGYRDAGLATFFFSPLPKHLFEALPSQVLLSSESSSRLPIGWGPYTIQEWTPGDHITLSRNPNYFRADESLPRFDLLVFRFVTNQGQALEALQAGECDVLDETVNLETRLSDVMELQNSGKADVYLVNASAWEHLDFGILSLNSNQPPLFSLRETRQAVAMCVDRQKIVDELFLGQSQVPDSYVPPTHPLFNPQVKQYAFNPAAGAALLESVGWLDVDGNPATPRIASGVPGVADGTLFEFIFLTTTEEEKQRAAQIIQESVGRCGIKAEISGLAPETLFLPGPQGQLFGRNFAMAQFGWVTALQPPCFLYTTSEIPGFYPEFPKGWGGSNVSGYSNSEFDRLCQVANLNLPETPQYISTHQQIQALFAEELPVLPLYSRLRAFVSRPDFCGVILEPYALASLWNLESFDYGEACEG